MPKFEINNNKILKLTNVLIYSLMMDINTKLEIEVAKMENYVKSKGSAPLGPLIQYISPNQTFLEDTSFGVMIKLMRQSTNFINHTEPPYSMESIIRVKDCIYTRFIGKESDLGIAYEKIKLVAYEEDFDLVGDSYTIFLENESGQITADIFMERANQ